MRLLVVFSEIILSKIWKNWMNNDEQITVGILMQDKSKISFTKCKILSDPWWLPKTGN